MENSFKKLGGWSLIIGTVLMIFTMVLHPSGGNVESIIKIFNLAVVTHSIAVLSIPFMIFGFWCLAQFLDVPSKLNYLALIVMSLSLLCVMIAAILNGLLLPVYAKAVKAEVQAYDKVIYLITRYGTTLNAVLTFVFIGGFSIAMLIWSAIIFMTNRMPKWITFIALFSIAALIALLVLKVNLVSVYGFRLYVFGIAAWIVSVGGFLSQKNKLT